MQHAIHHTLADLTRSDTAARHGLENTPDLAATLALTRLALGLDQVRALLGHSLIISSGYRSPQLNAAVGGVATSQHCRGEAADFTCAAFGTPIQVAEAIVAAAIDFDQCILEFGRWVHISFTTAPRRRALTIHTKAEGYLDGIVARA